jgi:hypothetical protein
MANEKLKRYKSLGNDQIPTQVIKARGKPIHSFNLNGKVQTNKCTQLH